MVLTENKFNPSLSLTKRIAIGYLSQYGKNGLVVKAPDSQSRGPVFKTTGWLQGRLILSSFRVR